MSKYCLFSVFADFVADAGFEPAVSFWETGAYETPEIGHFSNPQYFLQFKYTICISIFATFKELFFILLFWLDLNQRESNFFNSESTCRKNSGGFRDASLTTSCFSHLRTKHFLFTTMQRYLIFLD